ncbi:DUF4189 domain-containing protein [Lysobacter enzymogenes]
MRNSGRIFSVSLLLGVLAFHNACAEQGCPDGFVPNPTWTQGQQQCIPGPPSAGGAAGRRAPRWGAIAMDNTSGKTGLSGGMSTKCKAETGALAQCQRKGGVGCELKLTYQNQCGALAWGEGRMATAKAPTLEEASDLALAECRRTASQCEIFLSNCSFAERVQ